MQDAQNINTTNIPLADAQNTNKQEPSPETDATKRSEVKESEETPQDICNISDSIVKSTWNRSRSRTRKGTKQGARNKVAVIREEEKECESEWF